MPTQMSAAKAAGVVQVGEGALDVFAATPQQPFAARATHAPAIAVDRVLRLRRLRPLSSPALGLSDVGANRDGLEVDHRLVAVIPLVGDDLGQLRWRRARSVRGLDL